MIVVGTDFSDDAHNALGVGLQMARALGSFVTLVHVKPHANAAMPQGAHEWLARNRMSEPDLVIRIGTPWLELIRHAEEQDVEMICIAAHGQSGYQALAAGSNARRLLLRSPVPVIVAPAVRKTLKIPQET